jgi:IclR family transcriptional regulator, KDG regulon repressor
MPEAPPAAKGAAVPAVERALDILERLRDDDRGQTLSELSLALGMPKNAAFRITHALLARGYVSRDPRTMRFSLTSRLLDVGRPRVGRVPLVEAALEPMRELRDRTRETVQLGVRLDRGGVVVSQMEGLEPLRIAVDVGLQFAFHDNAPGKLLLAWLPERERQATIDRLELTASTERTITSRAELARECARIRGSGYAVDHAEADPGIHCVAAPIQRDDGGCVATVWISAPARRMPKGSFREFGGLVIATGLAIARGLGGGD